MSELELDFFNPYHHQRLEDLLLFSQEHQLPIALIAIVCPALVDVGTTLPYSSDIEFTDVAVPTPESKKVIRSVQKIQEATEMLRLKNVEVNIHLMVSNIQPILYRLSKEPEEHLNFLNDLSPTFQEYIKKTGKLRDILLSMESVTDKVMLHAQVIMDQLPQCLTYELHNHLDLLAKTITGGVEQSSSLGMLQVILSEMDQLTFEWKHDDFLQALYGLDLMFLSDIFSPLPTVWLNMQSHNNTQTELFSQAVVSSNVQIPVIKNIRFIN